MYFIKYTSIILFTLFLIVNIPVIIVSGDESGSENETLSNSFPSVILQNETQSTHSNLSDEIAQQNASPPEPNQTPSSVDLKAAFTGWYDKGVNASTKGNFQAASEAFAAALRINKTSTDAQMQYATTLTALGRDKEALTIYQDLLNQTPTADSAILIPYGKTLNAVGDYEAALSTLIQVTTKYPENQDAWNQLAAAYAGLSRYEEAITSVRRSLQISPENSGGWGQLGTVLYGQGRFYEAIAALEKSIRLSPDEPAYPVTLGDCWVALSQYQEAIDVYQTILEKNQTHTTVLQKLGDLYTKTGKIPEASEMYARARGDSQGETEPLSETRPSNQTPEVTDAYSSPGEHNQSQVEFTQNSTASTREG